MSIVLPRISKVVRRVGDRALDLLFPPLCAGCSVDLDAVESRTRFCDGCLARLPPIDEPVCPRCAARVPATDGVTLDCSHCGRDRLWFDQTLALGWYEEHLRELILRMKSESSGLLAKALIELAKTRFANCLADLAVDMVAPTPVHFLRQWQRGANPPALLSAALARRMNWQHDPRLLRRIRNTPRQRGLTRPGRFRNVRGEMALSRGRSVRGASILLVDDVMTTGATSSEAARVLKRAGAANVAVLVIARTDVGG